LLPWIGYTGINWLTENSNFLDSPSSSISSARTNERFVNVVGLRFIILCNMQQSSVRHRSSSNPIRVSTIERNDKSLTRTDQRKTQTLRKSKGEASHIPRPRFRSSSSDRAGSLGRKSYLKTTGKALHVKSILKILIFF